MHELKFVELFKSEKPFTGIVLRAHSASRFVPTRGRDAADILAELAAFSKGWTGGEMSPLIHTEWSALAPIAAPIVAAVLDVRTPDDESVIHERIGKFPLAPTGIINGVTSLTPFWSLTEPLPVGGTDQFTHGVRLTAVLVRLQRKLAVVQRRISLGMVMIPLVGTSVTVHGENIVRREGLRSEVAIPVANSRLVPVTLEPGSDEPVDFTDLFDLVDDGNPTAEKTQADAWRAALAFQR